MQEVARDGIECREWLIHQQDVTILSERARQRNALFHATRELVRKLVARIGEVDQRQKALRLFGTLFSTYPAQAQRQLDVPAGGEPRHERGVLKHDGCAARRHVHVANAGAL